MVEEEPWLREEKFLSKRVLNICVDHVGNAENVSDATIDGDHEALAYVKGQYEKGRDEAVEIAIGLQDQFYRHASLYYILMLCMRASDFRLAIVIARAITTRTIQDRILEEYPEYFRLDEKDGTLHPSVIASAGGILI
jgi:hypothetical protein